MWQSRAPWFEQALALLDDKAGQLLLSRESPSQPPNLYRLEPGRPASLAMLTHMPHPTPQLQNVGKQLLRYRRADGVELTATLYLPPGYQAKRDGPLPLLMWAYPTEFKTAAAASQVTESPYRFNRISYWGRWRCWRAATRCWTTPACPSSAKATKNRTTAICRN